MAGGMSARNGIFLRGLAVSYVAKADKVNDGVAFVLPSLQGEGLVVVEIDAPFADGFLCRIALVGESLMQLRLVEGEEDLGKTDAVAIPVLFRVGKAGVRDAWCACLN
jgi:hypothetical protein